MAASSRFGAHQSWITGSGTLATESPKVGDFSRVSLEGMGEVIIRQTGTESLTITADDNVLPYLTSEIRSGTLILSIESGVSFQPVNTIRYVVTAQELSGIDLSGSGTVQAGSVESPKLRVTLSGSGTITVAGTVAEQTVELSGSGAYLAPDLQSSKAIVTISGSGDATVSATDRLDVTISGVGSVRYSGHPEVRQNILGPGSVRPAL